MKTKSKQSGLTLPEMVVVIATIALLVGFGLPAIRSLLNSFESQSGAKTMISASLASARADFYIMQSRYFHETGSSNLREGW